MYHNFSKKRTNHLQLKRRINHFASFKDPAAKVFLIEDENENIYRELYSVYRPHYNHFKSSGLADELIKKNWVIPFEELIYPNDSIILKTRKIPFVSFPYEWTFNQWKDAALLTLKIQFQALKYGMILKDATPFNIVFKGNKPIFVDISSFEIFNPSQPWQAFKQFSENFYMPILLVKYFDSTGNEIYMNNLNGISLNKGLSLLPAKAFFNFDTLFFLALPGKIRNTLKDKESKNISKKFTLKSSMDFAEQLFSIINKLSQSKLHTKWNDYYEKNIDPQYLQEKEMFVNEWVNEKYKDSTLIDFGCNTGYFSQLLAGKVQQVIAFDDDMRSIDKLYLQSKEKKVNNIYSFTANLSQPTPALGWNNMERQALKERLHADIGLALALVHHLAISNQIQFNMLADFFANTCNELVIEFVPKDDPKVKLLLLARKDIYEWYNWENFMESFKTKFNILKEHHFFNNRVLVHFILKQNEQ